MSYNSTYTGAEIDDAVGKVLNGSVPKADKVGHTLTINGTSFDGSADKTINIKASGDSAVTGVKGSAEGSYRTGNVNLTVANLGVNASTTELNYCKGVTSEIQTQLNSKVPTSRTINGKNLSSNISLAASDVGAVKNGGVTGEDGTHNMALSWSGSDIIAGVDNNAAVKTLVDKETIRTAITIQELPSGCSDSCYYYPDLSMCFLRLYYTGKALKAANVANVGLVPSGYRPNSRFALSVACLQDYGKTNMAYVSTDGVIKYIPEVAKEAADDTYITGFWFV